MTTIKNRHFELAQKAARGQLADDEQLEIDGACADNTFKKEFQRVVRAIQDFESGPEPRTTPFTTRQLKERLRLQEEFDHNSEPRRLGRKVFSLVPLGVIALVIGGMSIMFLPSYTTPHGTDCRGMSFDVVGLYPDTTIIQHDSTLVENEHSLTRADYRKIISGIECYVQHDASVALHTLEPYRKQLTKESARFADFFAHLEQCAD
ncbi:MAG: hypothetical protein KDC12_11770 [Flavobacteriales bacterium]|nr:hypothetical protein [Flavobacteriales bacterium]